MYVLTNYERYLEINFHFNVCKTLIYTSDITNIAKQNVRIKSVKIEELLIFKILYLTNSNLKS